MGPLDQLHPALRDWFERRFGAPTPPQAKAWPAIRAGGHVLLAAPTGSGKTLAAFLEALDSLLHEGAVEDACRVLYVSPLRALSNDVSKNLLVPLEELRELDPDLPELRVAVRTGDTTSAERARMLRKPPHVLVTTPESLYVLLTSRGGRGLLGHVRTVIVDEVHAVLASKRGAHLALSLERLERLVVERGGAVPQRIGLSATQKPLADVGRFLVGPEREVTLIDEGHGRVMDLSVEVPSAPLEAVCSHESWSLIHRRIAELVDRHTSTLVFVNTRKVAERAARELQALLPEGSVTSHHSSLSIDRRHDAEARLKAGELKCLVATASLELGIDVGDVDLVVQVGVSRSIATFLQRVGRSGHALDRTPKGVAMPVSPDELAEAAALLLAHRRGELDRTQQPAAPLDIAIQQVIAECVAARLMAEDDEGGALGIDGLLEWLRRSWPYREFERERLLQLIGLHSGERGSLLHFDAVADTVRATRKARIIAVTSGGAIPDKADYRVVEEPTGRTVGTVDEDFAVESSSGDIFQLGNMSWRVLRHGSGVMHVLDAEGAAPSLPFWFGEAPARTPELSALIGEVRERGVGQAWLEQECGLPAEAALELARYLSAGAAALGAVPTPARIVLERFPDDSGGMQLIVHALFGGRINRAFGLALRKRFCRRFGFELQAAANEEAVLISLSPEHSFELEGVLDYLDAQTVREVLTQALLDSPMFQTRWRWNVSRSLLSPRAPAGKRLPPQIQRMRSDDLLAKAFPDVIACGENLPPGDLEIPEGHPILDATIDDCLHEAMDVEGLEGLLERLANGAIERVAVDRPEPSPFAEGALAIGPYGFLDDAGLEERRTQAVRARGGAFAELATTASAEVGVLRADAVAAVALEAWPDPRDAAELAEALGWMGYATDEEVERSGWCRWAAELATAGRAVARDGRWFAPDASTDALDLLRARLEVVVPVRSDDPNLALLETEGVTVRVRLEDDAPGRPQAWCHRRLFARILRRQRDRRRARVRPIPTAAFRAFLAGWHGMDPALSPDAGHRFEGPEGVLRAVERLAGWEAAAPLWESALLPARVKGYQPEMLDHLGLAGEVAWGRLFGSSELSPKATPIALFPRSELAVFESLAGPAPTDELSGPAERVLTELERRGSMFRADLENVPGLLSTDAERGLDELISRGLCCSDSFQALRPLLRAPAKRRRPRFELGRWTPFRRTATDAPDPEAAARILLRRYGVVFRALIHRERLTVPWRDLLRALRLLELAGRVHGGRFVDGYSGEQFALPEAIPLLRRATEAEPKPLALTSADPLELDSTLRPGTIAGSRADTALQPENS